MKSKQFTVSVIVPAFIYISIFLFLPIVLGLAISFTQYNPLRDDNKFVGLANYARLFHDELFLKAARQTLVFVFAAVLLNIIFSLLIAQGISIFHSNIVRSLFRMVFFLPCVAPMVASAIVWGKSIYPTKTGLINLVIRQFGMHPVNWLGDEHVVMWSVIIYTLWADIGYNIILFSAGIDGIPGEMYEAARVDGAGGVKLFRYITLPLLARTTTFVVLMTLTSYFQMFAQFAAMLTKSVGPNNSGLVLTSLIYNTAFVKKDMGYASAISMALFIVVLIISVIQQHAEKIDWEY